MSNEVQAFDPPSEWAIPLFGQQDANAPNLNGGIVVIQYRETLSCEQVRAIRERVNYLLRGYGWTAILIDNMSEAKVFALSHAVNSGSLTANELRSIADRLDAVADAESEGD